MARQRTAPRAARMGTAAFSLAAIGGLLLPHHAAAQITGPCSAYGFETAGKMTAKEAVASGPTSGVNVSSENEWHVHKDSYLSGTGTADSVQTFANVYVAVYGFNFPIVQATGKGQGGSAGPFHVSDWSTYGRSIAVYGDSDSCSGSLMIIVDDVNPATTAAGGGGLAATALGAAGVAGVALRKRGF